MTLADLKEIVDAAVAKEGGHNSRFIEVEVVGTHYPTSCQSADVDHCGTTVFLLTGKAEAPSDANHYPFES